MLHQQEQSFLHLLWHPFKFASQSIVGWQTKPELLSELLGEEKFVFFPSGKLLDAFVTEAFLTCQCRK